MIVGVNLPKVKCPLQVKEKMINNRLPNNLGIGGTMPVGRTPSMNVQMYVKQENIGKRNKSALNCVLSSQVCRNQTLTLIE